MTTIGSWSVSSFLFPAVALLVGGCDSSKPPPRSFITSFLGGLSSWIKNCGLFFGPCVTLSYGTFASAMICVVIHPIPITRVQIIPFHNICAIRQHARAARPHCPAHSWASELSVAHTLTKHDVAQKQHPNCIHVCMICEKKWMHLCCRCSVGSNDRPRSSRW